MVVDENGSQKQATRLFIHSNEKRPFSSIFIVLFSPYTQPLFSSYPNMQREGNLESQRSSG